MQKILSIMLQLLPSKQVVTNPLDVLPDFRNFTYKIAIKPDESRVKAWTKIQECERRLEMYKWIKHLNNPAKDQHRILLNDSVSAFLLTFEATLQFLGDQFFEHPSELGNWLVKQEPHYDIAFRGLRTLRHFEAHVESQPTQSDIVAVGGNISRTPKLKKLQESDLEKLKRSPLKSRHLSDWNRLVAQQNIESIFTDNLRKLKEILRAAESLTE